MVDVSKLSALQNERGFWEVIGNGVDVPAKLSGRSWTTEKDAKSAITSYSLTPQENKKETKE